MKTIAIVAGESSGDLLGSHLIRSLKSSRSDLKFIGIAGPKMMKEGAVSLFLMEELSVRGYFEAFKKLFHLIQLRKNLLNQILNQKPDLFIGVDAPDFNFWIERQLKKKGIPVIHYVSPSIWAWRGNRLRKIKKSVDHMLTIFPFEKNIYSKANIQATFVGHPLAEMIPLYSNKKKAQDKLKIIKATKVIALLPGSRQGEVTWHAQLLIDSATEISKRIRDVKFLVPLPTRETYDIFSKTLFKNTHAELDIQLLVGHASDAINAADLVIVASGTATLETALYKKPMIVIYKMSSISWQILKRMRYLPFVSLPNILLNKFIVPELLQSDATSDNISSKAIEILKNAPYRKNLLIQFTKIHHQLKQNTSDRLSKVILKFIK
ncbi:MAG: lipid-A-disaccharide synthase [Methylophilaceae bacterium]|jgi:lipid-A-disaccharide synthase|nr:lipid-A-disaccharide synthase [Methylophilaceae bacterium]